MSSAPICRHDPEKTCEPSCAQDEGAVCSSTGWVSLARAQERFQTEATRGTVHTGRYSCSYSSWGNGPPLVFIHGLADLSASFLLPMSILSRGFLCIGYELPDGRVDGANLRRYTHADLVADLLVLLDHLKIDKAYLFGSSFGSTIALAALHEHPARFPRALLQGGFARRPLRIGEWLLASCMRFVPGSLRHLPLRNRSMHRYHHGPLAERAELWEYFLQCAGTPRIGAVARRALLMQALDLRPILPEIRQPVLVICGDQDPLVGKPCEEELLQGLPSSQRIEIPGCGHYPYFSHPEVLAEIIRLFLTRSS